MIYLLGAMALVAALSGLYGAWEHKGRLTAEAQVAEREAQMARQNDAIAATKAEGDRRVAAAQKGIVTAIQTTKAAQTEAERLRGLQATPTPAGDCPAGMAVAEVRRGLQ